MHRRPPGWELYESDNWLDRGLFGELMLHHNTDCVMCITLCNDIDTSGHQGLEFWELAVIEWVDHIETLDRRQFVGYNYGFWFRFYINCVNYIETGGWYGPSPYKATIGSSSRHRPSYHQWCPPPFRAEPPIHPSNVIVITVCRQYHWTPLSMQNTSSGVETRELAQSVACRSLLQIYPPQLSSDWLCRKYVPRQRNASIDKTVKNARRTKRTKSAHWCTNGPMCADTRPWWTPGGRGFLNDCLLQIQNAKYKYEYKHDRQIQWNHGTLVDTHFAQIQNTNTNTDMPDVCRRLALVDSAWTSGRKQPQA